MATFAIAPMHFARLSGLESIPIEHVPAGATAFAAGEILKTSSGTAVPVVADDKTGILGCALHARVATGEDIAYVRSVAGVLFEATLESSSSPGYALLAADLGVQYGLNVSSGKTYVDKAEVTALAVTVKSFVSAVGDVRARVLVEFIPGTTL